MTSLEFDNAGNQTSPSDEDIEWNDDNAVVSNDAKHMKKKSKTTKNVVVKDKDDDDSSHFSQLSSTMLQSEAKSPPISQLSSFNSYIQCSAGVVNDVKQTRNKENSK